MCGFSFRLKQQFDADHRRQPVQRVRADVSSPAEPARKLDVIDTRGAGDFSA
jgi:sugar/nucleoside kinase (ribokinase family)